MLAATHPFSLILFGASGHLAQAKIYPALYTLALKKRLPKEYAIVGFARSTMDRGAFQTLVADAIRKDMIEVNEKVLTEFLAHVHYVEGQYTSEEDFRRLATLLGELEGRGDVWVRLAYLSIPPMLFTAVLKNLCAGGVHTPPKAFRCIVEKPVGHDLASAGQIYGELIHCFADEEVFLLDHYLGKEAVRNIYYLRAANPVLERLFKNTLIHSVEVAALESAGIEGRAGYFENTGTLRDMVQSHLLEMCALLTMRMIGEGESFREARQHALEELYLPPAADLGEIILQGQYAAGAISGSPVPAFITEEGVAEDSRTNTFIAMKLLSRTSRWQGVPFYLRTGKRLAKKETRISIAFQAPTSVGKGETKNRLDIILQGEAGMRLSLQTKMGGTEPTFRPLILEDPLVCIGDCLPEHGLLLLEAIHGQKQWFLRFREVETCWRLVGPLQAFLDNPKTPLHAYPAGTAGPKEADAWIARDHTQWLP